MSYEKNHYLYQIPFFTFLMAIALILVGHKNNFDYKDNKTPQAGAKGKKSSKGENNYLFWIVLGESWI